MSQRTCACRCCGGVCPACPLLAWWAPLSLMCFFDACEDVTMSRVIQCDTMRAYRSFIFYLLCFCLRTSMCCLVYSLCTAGCTAFVLPGVHVLYCLVYRSRPVAQLYIRTYCGTQQYICTYCGTQQYISTRTDVVIAMMMTMMTTMMIASRGGSQ